MIKNCPVCSKEFNALGPTVNCSPECTKQAKRIRNGHFNTREHFCPNCKEKFEPVNGKQVFCSEECWRDANSERLKARSNRGAMRHHDKKMFGGNREIVLLRDGHKCTKCGSTNKVGVYHKEQPRDGEDVDHSLDNLIALCGTCYFEEYVKRESVAFFSTACQQCGKEFKTTLYRQSIGSGKYCSKECSDAGHVKLKDSDELTKASRPNWFKVVCSNCGIEFEVPPHRIASGKALYCSRSCRTIVENRKRAKPKPEKPVKLIAKEGYKFCIKCGDELLATEEFFHKRVDNGVAKLKSTCKKCTSLQGIGNYATNRDAIRERQKKSHDKNKDESNARSRERYQNGGKEKKSAYYVENKDVINEKATKRREANRENIRVIAREYSKRPEVMKRKAEQRKANPEKYRNRYNLYYRGEGKERIIAIGKRRDAKKKNAVATLTPEQWLDTLESFGNCCVYCGDKLTNVQQDHVIPVSSGGGYTKKNMLPACKSCNSSKHNHSLEEWYPKQPSFSPERLTKIHSWIGFDSKSNTQQLALY